MKDLLDYTYPWLTVAILGTVGAVVAVAAQHIAYAVLRRIARFSVIASTVVEFTAAPARLAAPLLAFVLVLSGAPEDLPARALAERAVTMTLIAALTWMALRAVGAVGEAIVRLHPATVTDNLQARRIQTQTRVLTRTVKFFVLIVGGAALLMTLPGMRQVGASLLASAGVVGVVGGIAARPVFGNLIAGLQIALTQPIRLDDVVIMENEWGRIEEITATYVVVKIWDERRLVVPLEWIIQHPFQNWTRTGSQLLGTVYLWVDYRVPLAPLRAELERVCEAAPEWDRRVCMIQVTEANERAVQIRALVSAGDASLAWDLRCRVREALIDFLQREHPDALPRMRAELDRAEHDTAHPAAAPPPVRAGKGDSSAIKKPSHPEVQVAGDARAPAQAQTDVTGKGA
ncbi:MAG TPA: mechanosensitive ion channel family protein [Burkholderiales bacterium]|nr:mechanosensitive ion channel family protein [Burkholderiales bacterium]